MATGLLLMAMWKHVINLQSKLQVHVLYHYANIQAFHSIIIQHNYINTSRTCHVAMLHSCCIAGMKPSSVFCSNCVLLICHVTTCHTESIILLHSFLSSHVIEIIVKVSCRGSRDSHPLQNQNSRLEYCVLQRRENHEFPNKNFCIKSDFDTKALKAFSLVALSFTHIGYTCK